MFSWQIYYVQSNTLLTCFIFPFRAVVVNNLLVDTFTMSLRIPFLTCFILAFRALIFSNTLVERFNMILQSSEKGLLGSSFWFGCLPDLQLFIPNHGLTIIRFFGRVIFLIIIVISPSSSVCGKELLYTSSLHRGS